MVAPVFDGNHLLQTSPASAKIASYSDLTQHSGFQQVDFIQNNIFLVMIAAVSGGMLLWPVLAQRGGGSSLSTLQATQLINQKDALVLDVRSSDDYARGHILNARSVPAAQLDSRLSELEKFKNRPLIVSCQTGTTAGATCAALKKAGFNEVYTLTGGVAAWQTAGLPVSK